MRYCNRRNCKHAHAAHFGMKGKCMVGELTKHPCRCRQYQNKELDWSTARSKMDLKRLYLSLVPILRETARQNGYAIGIHGSLTRDLDLIAAPWTPRAVSALTLAKRMCLAVTGYSYKKFVPTKKPHGRLAFSFYIGTHAYIDLSIVPRVKYSAE